MSRVMWHKQSQPPSRLFECHHVVIIIENCDVSNQKIKCLAPRSRQVDYSKVNVVVVKWNVFCPGLRQKFEIELLLCWRVGGEGGWSQALPLPTSDNEDKTLMGTYFIIIIELVVLTYFIGNKLFKWICCFSLMNLLIILKGGWYLTD